MRLVLLDCNDDDAIQIFSHTYYRSHGLFIEKGRGYIYIDVDTIAELSFLTNVLRCKLLFSPHEFEHNGLKYSTIKIVREEHENKDSGDGILPKEQVV